MIFKKPYAFLIKYFKVINFILAILSVYIAYRTYNIITFFGDYITSNYTGSFYYGFSDTYISAFVYFIIILIILGIFGVTVLLLYKKKSSKAYISSLIYYIVLIIFLVVIKNLMISLETNVIKAETARIFRDLSLISIVPQGIFIILFIMRGFGFNINKFNFQQDLKDLEVSEQDSEEIEITIKGDGVKLRRNIRRFIREFKYYIKENKFIFIIICTIVIITSGYLVYKALPEVVDNNYIQGDKFTIDGLNYQLIDSIITNLDYKGDIIRKDVYYVVVKLFVENKTDDVYNFDYNKFKLEVNNRYIYPIKDKAVNFIDYANGYYSNEIKANSSYTLSLIFEIKNSEVKKHYQIKLDNGLTFSNDIQIGKFNYITITPTIIDKLINEGNYNQDEEISFINSNLGNSSLKLSNVIITDKYVYNYEFCNNEKCNTYKNQINIDYMLNNKLLIVMDYDYNLDQNVAFYNYSKNINKFIDSFVKIKYIKNDDEYYYSIRDVTPSNLKDKIILETTSDISNATELFLSIVIRNKEYLINLK